MWPVNPQVKHSPELMGEVPGRSGYGVDSVMRVPGPWFLIQSACWAWCALLPASVSGCCGYFASWACSATLSAWVGGGLGVFAGLACANRLPRPPLVLVNMFAVGAIPCCAAELVVVWFLMLKVDI